MKRNFILFIAISITLLIVGCGEDKSGGASPLASVTQGWHNQGKNCLACHNYDLQDERKLLFAGTVYKKEDTTNLDDLNGICGGDLNVNFWNASRTKLMFASKDYIDPNSKGNRGKGNIFILQRLLLNIPKQSTKDERYFLEITDGKGNILTSYIHQFSGLAYDIKTPTDFSNRISCNACHTKGGVRSPIYVDSDKEQFCK